MPSVTMLRPRVAQVVPMRTDSAELCGQSLRTSSSGPSIAPNKNAGTTCTCAGATAPGSVRAQPAVARDKTARSCLGVATWWAQQGLNLRLRPCEGRTLPLSYAPEARFGLPGRTLTAAESFLQPEDNPRRAQ